MSRLDEIRERVEGATPGPWEWVAEGPGEGNITLRTTGRGYDDHILTPHVCEACEKRGARCLAPTAENAAFIAAAREDVPFLLAEVERLRGALEEASALVTGPGNGTWTRIRPIEEWRRLDHLFREAKS